jgi:DNA-binding MarR family transcriptional regulator
MKNEFLNFLDKLMEASPNIVDEYMTDNIKNYLEIFKDESLKKSEITESGRKILEFLQNYEDTTKLWKAKDIAQELGVTSRGVSGSIRKLVNDGYCEKLGTSPAVYTITEKGLNYKFND